MNEIDFQRHQSNIMDLIQDYMRKNKVSQADGMSILSMVGSKFVVGIIKELDMSDRKPAIEAFLKGVKHICLTESQK